MKMAYVCVVIAGKLLNIMSFYTFVFLSVASLKLLSKCGRIIKLFCFFCSLQTLNEALASGNKEQSKAALEKQVRDQKHV